MEMNKKYVGFEYREIAVSKKMEPVVTDGYMNFGWLLEKISVSTTGGNKMTVYLKRDREIRNKGELARLQRQFEATVKEIETLEFSKSLRAAAIAYAVGVIGTMLIFTILLGSTTIATATVAIPIVLGWIAPYWIYKELRERKSAEVGPIIEQKYDEIYGICETASGLLAEAV